jgi:Ca-activated chloride channel family protein
MLALCAAALAAGPLLAVETEPLDPFQAAQKDVTQGALRVVRNDGTVVECPLKHTDVEAEVSGFIARVKVTQVFSNPLQEKIEAVYVFPLPHKAAVDDMTMVIGERRIVGVIKRRAEARAIYEAALAAGATAALLEQERPNIFTQSVGNIKSGEEVRIEISYVDVLEYDMGVYTFHFPMVVGPRYIPGGATSAIPPMPEELKGKVGELDRSKVPQGPAAPKGTGWAPDTDRVPDASRITPPVLKPGYRNGHDVSLAVFLDAGVPIQDLSSPNHKAKIVRQGPSQASASIEPADSIPNKDFVLKYAVVGSKPEMAVLSHTDPAGQGYLLLMVQPKEDERLTKAPPREVVFLVDVSGSMSGGPIAKVIQAMQGLLGLTKADDTFQVVKFAGMAQKLFDKAVPCTAENMKAAQAFVEAMEAGGGTEMLKGVRMALGDPPDPKRVRIVIMLTDGYIGNEKEIIEEVGKRCGDQIRFWCIGIGQSPNRFLIDGVAKQGGGMAKVLGLNEDTTALVQEVMTRIHRAQLAKIQVDWGTLRVFETYPARIPELWAGRPVVLFGLYSPGGGASEIRLTGQVEGEPAAWPLRVALPAREPRHDVLAKVWARQKIEDLMQSTYYAGSPVVEDAVTSVALEYRLMSQYTSFVAVDESDLGKMAEPARPPRRMLVPVPIPEGTRYEGFFGPDGEDYANALASTGGLNINTFGYMAKTEALARLKAPIPAMAPAAASGPMPAFAGTPLAKPYGPAPDGRRLALGINWEMASQRANGKFAVRAATAGPGLMPHETYHGDLRGTALLRGLGDLGVLKDRNGEFDLAYTGQALAADSQKTAKLAADALKSSEELKKKGDLLAARARYAWAYLLDAASGGQGDVSDKALDAIEAINKQLLDAWKKDVPALDKRLDLVIRDAAIEDALEAVAGRGAGLKTDGLIGGTGESVLRQDRKALRVTYLDLRGATIAQALDWILVPERMTWRLDAATRTLQGGTGRSGPVPAPWVYDAPLIALPSAKDLEKISDYQKRIEAVKKESDAFLAAVRKHVGAKDDEIVWYAPGQLAVFADSKGHERAAKVLADLADPKARVEKDLADLQRKTSARAEGRKGAAEKLAALQERARMAAALEEHGWRLLAEAAAGRLDLEALTHLQAAWKGPEAAALLEVAPAGNVAEPAPRTAFIPMRSFWAVTEAARALPKEKELADLAASLRQRCFEAGRDAAKALDKAPEDPALFLATLYGALAFRDEADYAAQASELLGQGAADSPLAAARTIAKALLAPQKEIDAKALEALIAKGPRGDDLVALLALASRRAGGETWPKFRAESQELLGGQPLSGAVVVFISRLAGPDLRIAAAK